MENPAENERLGETVDNNVDPYEGLDEPAIERREAGVGSRVERRLPTIGATPEPVAARPRPTVQSAPPEPPELHETPEPTRPTETPESTGRLDSEAEPSAPMPVTSSVETEPAEAEAENRGAQREPSATEKKAPEVPKPTKQKIIAFRVIARMPERFDGTRLRDALQKAGFLLGRYDIFHWLSDQGRPVFSLASLLEPGTFNLPDMAHSAYPGVAIFAVFPGPLPAPQAFEEMLSAARFLARELDGLLQDERGAPLTERAIINLRQTMPALERELRGGSAPV
jgi:cell division protein ZipA